MADLIIPINSSSAFYKFRINLEDEIYYFQFKYNTRSLKWYMNVYNDADTILLAGIPVLGNAFYFGRFNDENLPPGNTFIVDFTNSESEPTRTNFGIDIKLIYEESA